MSEQIVSTSNKLQNQTNNQMFTRFTIRGTVIRKIRLPKSLIFTVISSSSSAARVRDFPRFVAFENLDKLDRNFSVGDRVTVNGYIHTSKKYPEGTLIPVSVTPEKYMTRIDAAFSSQSYKTDENRVVLRGVLASEPFAPNDSITLATVEVKSDKGTSYIRAICFGRAAGDMKHKRKGDVVEAIGYIRTKPMNEVKDRSHTQSLVITAVR